MRQGFRYALLSAIALAALGGCATWGVQPTEYVVAVGQPVTFKYANWTFDLCAEENADAPPGELSGCVQFGGELYRASFTDLQVLAGHLPSNTRYLGIVGHAFLVNQHRSPPMLLVLRRSGPNVLRETGLTYFTIAYRHIGDALCFS